MTYEKTFYFKEERYGNVLESISLQTNDDLSSRIYHFSYNVPESDKMLKFGTEEHTKAVNHFNNLVKTAMNKYKIYYLSEEFTYDYHNK